MASDTPTRRVRLIRAGNHRAKDKPRAIDHNWPPRMAALWRLLRRKDCDVSVARLYAALGLSNTDAGPVVQQMRVGAVISRINVKLAEHGRIIKPGLTRRSYRNYSRAAFK